MQRAVFEQNFPGGGRAETVRSGERLIWNFDVGSSALKPGHKQGIEDFAKEIDAALKADPKGQVDIEGQASSTGSADLNEPLAHSRAVAVKDALVSAGIGADRIRLTSVGSAKSLSGATQQEFARSRAVRIILAPRLAAPGPPAPGPAPQGAQGCPPPPTKLAVPLDLTGGKVTLENGVIRAGNAKTPGITVIAITMPPVKPACGEFAFVQNVQPFFEIVYKDASRNRLEVSTWHLDNSDAYPCQNVPFNHMANDSPGFGVGAAAESDIRTIEIRHEFRMFYLFTPTGQPRYTLEVGRWTWIAQARNMNPARHQGRVELDAGISRVIPEAGSGQATSELPALSPNVADAKFVTDTKAGPTGETIAKRHLPFLKLPPALPPAPTCTKMPLTLQ